MLLLQFVDSDVGATTTIAVKHGSHVEHRTIAPSTDGSPMVPLAAAKNTVEPPLVAGATANAGDDDTATGAGGEDNQVGSESIQVKITRAAVAALAINLERTKLGDKKDLECWQESMRIIELERDRKDKANNEAGL